MKIRSDFVTNSSSSSYTTVQVQNKVLCELLRSYKNQMQLETVSPNVIALIPFRREEDVGYSTDCPANYEEAVARVWELLDRRAQACPELHTKLVKARADIDACYEKILFVDGYEEWGGDGDRRYEWPLPDRARQDGAGEEGAYYYSADLAAGSASETSGYTYYSLKKRPPVIFGFDHPNLLRSDFEKKSLAVPKIDTVAVAREYTEQLNDFVISNHVLVQYIGFGGDVVIPDMVTSIDKQAFQQSKTLVSITIPSSVTTIESDTFWRCEKLTSVTLPRSITSIDSFAFSDCKSLASINLPNSVTSIGYGAFGRCESLTSITLPSSIKTIEPSTFNGCKNLIALSIPDSVTSIGEGAFERSGLENIIIPNSVTSIGKEAFSGCRNLKSITIPDSVGFIGKDAFLDCFNLTNVKFSNFVNWASRGIFDSCSGLADESGLAIVRNRVYACKRGVKSITIPDSVTTIGKRVFYSNGSLESVFIPNSVTSIGEEAFESCGLTDIVIPNSVTSIDYRAFACCNGLTSLIIPKSVKYIGPNAFLYCGKLESLRIDASSISIDDNAFADCNKLKTIITKKVLPRKAFVDTKFRNPIATSDPALLPPKAQPMAMVGYAENPEEFVPGRQTAHMKYLEANAPKLLKQMLAYPALLRLTLENQLLSPETADSFLREAIEKGKTEAVTMLNAYLGNESSSQTTEAVTQGPSIAGKTFVVTGDLVNFPDRTNLKAYIEANGGRLTGSVSAKTDYLISNDGNSTSTKTAAAKAKHIPIITEQQFIELFHVKSQIGAECFLCDCENPAQ